MICYLCGKPATNPLNLPASFTAHSVARAPHSDRLCDRCHDVVSGEEKLLWYWNESKGKWSRLWGRSLSRLYLGECLASPTIEGSHTEKNKTFPVVQNLPTRAQIRSWLLNPPTPPFTIVIPESGQKHILPWAIEAQDQECFPVQFELDSVWVRRVEFAAILCDFEALMALGFSKTEIFFGEYHSNHMVKAFPRHEKYDDAISPYRGSRLLALVAHVAQRPEVAESASEPPKLPAKNGQLRLL